MPHKQSFFPFFIFFVGEQAKQSFPSLPTFQSQFPPCNLSPGIFTREKKNYIFLSLIFSTPFLSVRASCQQPLLLSHYSERFLLLFGQVAFSLSLSTLNPFTEISCRHNMVKVLRAGLCSSHCQWFWGKFRVLPLLVTSIGFELLNP